MGKACRMCGGNKKYIYKCGETCRDTTWEPAKDERITIKCVLQQHGEKM
jgi:hypothetical protein